ncbi:hypothetical protein JCM5296_005619 [Sporobolomyces johnsonii]
MPPPPPPSHPPQQVQRPSQPAPRPHPAPSRLMLLRQAQVELLGQIVAEAEASEDPEALLSEVAAEGHRLLTPRAPHGAKGFFPPRPRGKRAGRRVQEARRNAKAQQEEETQK